MRDDFEFLNRIHNGRHGVGAEKRREIVHAVGEKVVATVSGAIDGRKRESSSFGDRRRESACPPTHGVLTHADRRNARS